MRLIHGVIRGVKGKVLIFLENGLEVYTEIEKLPNGMKKGDRVLVAFDFTENKVRTLIKPKPLQKQSGWEFFSSRIGESKKSK
jgi:hypothetical protein